MTTPPDDIMDTLAAYALGALTPDEIARVEALLAAQPELRAQLAELRATADALPYGLPDAQPAADLRQRTLDYATGRASRRTARTGDGLAARAGLDHGAGHAGRRRPGGSGDRLGTGDRREQRRAPAPQRDRGRPGPAWPAPAADQRGQQGAGVARERGRPGGAAANQRRGGRVRSPAACTTTRPGPYPLWRIQGTNAPASAGLFTVSPQGFGQAELPGGQPPAAGEIIAVTDEPQAAAPAPPLSRSSAPRSMHKTLGVHRPGTQASPRP